MSIADWIRATKELSDKMHRDASQLFDAGETAAAATMRSAADTVWAAAASLEPIA